LFAEDVKFLIVVPIIVVSFEDEEGREGKRKRGRNVRGLQIQLGLTEKGSERTNE